jgi:hippurate hydrolase
MACELTSLACRRIEELRSDLINLRRALHREPELAFQEHATARRLGDHIVGLGLSPSRPYGNTGFYVDAGASKGPLVALRAEMDALPIHENTDLEFRSTVEGRMHACGHDVHMAIAMGVTAAFAKLGEDAPGRLRVIYQPAEEILEGALAMIRDGILSDPPRAILGFHNSPDLEAGKIGYCPGVSFASCDDFDVVIRGAASHAGRPEAGADAIVAGGQFITQAQAFVSRQVSPLAATVISITQANGGRARNIICDELILSGSIRSLSPADARTAREAMANLCEGLSKSTNCRFEFSADQRVPPLERDPIVLEVAVDGARAALGADMVLQLQRPTMGSEDFSHFSSRIPAAHLRVGSNTGPKQKPLHSDAYVCSEEAIEAGAKAMSGAILALLEKYRT